MSDSKYKHKDIVWCKCGGLFWPGEVCGLDSLPEEIREGFLKTPRVVVKFFDEDGYEFVLNDKDIFPYNCDKKEEFIKKGIARSRRKAKEGATGGWYAKFPKDVVHCEKLTKGNINILEEEPYVEKKEKKIDYSLIFGDPEEISIKKEELIQKSSSRKGRPRSEQEDANGFISTPKRITHPRFIGRSDHTVRILAQPSTPYHFDTNTKSPSQPLPPKYNCHMCDFAATRLNVIVLHNKSHSAPNRTNLANHERPKVSIENNVTKVSLENKPIGLPKKRPRVSSPKSSYDISSKRPRLNKRQKEEKKEVVKEKEEKKKAIFGDWSEDENEEEEEKVKLKETIENADSIPSSQESDSENRMTDDDFFSNTDDHHSIDSDDDFIVSNPKKQVKPLPPSIASTKPLRKRKVNLDSFTREHDPGKVKPKIGEKSKTGAMRNKKTESVVDAVNSLIKSKLQPNKTYVSSERSRLNSRTEIVDVLRKTPVKHKNDSPFGLESSTKKQDEKKMDVARLLSETTLPEIPSLPNTKCKNNSRVKSLKTNDEFETNFSSSDSGAQGASSAEEQNSPPVSPPPSTSYKKPGILRKSSARSIQLPTRPNGNSQLIKHEEGETKYAVISAKAKAKQLARTQMAKDELLAKKEESAAKEFLIKEESKNVIKIENGSSTETTGKSEAKELRVTQDTKEEKKPICNGEQLSHEEQIDEKSGQRKEEKHPEIKIEASERDVPDKKLVEIISAVTNVDAKVIKVETKENNDVKEKQLYKQVVEKYKTTDNHKEKPETNEIIEKSINSKKGLTSEFDFIDDLSKQSITQLSASRKVAKQTPEKSDIFDQSTISPAKISKPKIEESEVRISPDKKLSKIPPALTSPKKTEASPTKPLSKPPPLAKIEGVTSDKYSAFVNKNISASKIVQGVPKSKVPEPPSMVVIKPDPTPKVNTVFVKPPHIEPICKIIGSTTQSLSAPNVTISSLKTSKLITSPTETVVSKLTNSNASKPMISVVNQHSVTVSKTMLASSKPAVNLVCKTSPSLVSKPMAIPEKKPTVTIISKPNSMSIEKTAQFENRVPIKANINSGLTISKSQLEPAKKPVMATVSKLTIEPVVKPSLPIQSKTLASDTNKPVVAGFSKMSETFSSKSFVSIGSKQVLTQQPLSSTSKPFFVQNNKPSISSISKPFLSPLKMENKVVTLSHKKEPTVLKSPEVSSEIQKSHGTHVLLSPTKGSEKPLTVSLESKKIVAPMVERTKPIVKTVELPKRAVEVAAALKPLSSPTKPIVFMESKENKGKPSTLEIELDNTPVSEFLVAVNEPVIDANTSKPLENVLSINDLVVAEHKMAGASSIVIPADVGHDGLTAVNLSSGGLQFLGDQALGSDSDGEMIYLLVDDGTDPNLENQTLYIDPSQLAAATGGMILQNETGSGPLLLQTAGDRGRIMLQTSVGGNSVLMHGGNMLQGNDGQVIIQGASEAGQMFIQNADGQVVLQDNGALSNVVIVEDKDASAALHGLVTSADTTGGVATLPAHPSSSLLAQVLFLAQFHMIF
eukprot:TRINITY_DN18290_c0_g1_i2.p1 TRINITY_DN18290_c0_g1~~TRINITY_DN18290_c0_g1_i2.p1  ORF type:complete len:1544 (+),score=383.42 TRINITY_DN18290_c0_g1_i2:42-4634(+)